MPAETISLRLLVCDLDGTLLAPDGSVTERTLAAVRALRSGGVQLAIATGRIPSAIRRVMQDLDLAGPQVTMHGALVIDPFGGEPVYSATLDAGEVDELLDLAHELGLPPLLCYRDGFRTRVVTPEIAALFVPYNEPLPEEVGDLSSLRRSRPNKIAMPTGFDRYEEALAIARQRLANRYAITSGDNRSLEMLPAGVDKGRAAEELAGSLGLDPGEMGSIGDGTNDIELLRAARWSVAMRHARPEVRAAATAVVPDAMPDDLASAIDVMRSLVDLPLVAGVASGGSGQ